jgi:hypothetical protein
MTSLATADRTLKVGREFRLAYSMLPARVGNGVERSYWAADAEHPVLEKRRDGLRPFPHDLINRSV